MSEIPSINSLIVQVAESYVGKEELANNAGFIDKKLQEKMLTVGWQQGWAWCALFCELVWKEAYSKVNSLYIEKLDYLFSASATKTFSNFEDSNFFVSNKPAVGALVAWQYKDSWRGHLGIVTKPGNPFYTIEGNWGDKVSRCKKELSYAKGDVNLLGFVYPKRPF